MQSKLSISARRALAAALLCALGGVTVLPAGEVQAQASAPSAKKAPAAAAGPATFASPQQGVDALVAALRAGDRPALAALTGPGHSRLLESGDPAADKRDAAKFLGEYDAKHSLAMEGDSKAVLVVGSDDWPLPIPLVKGAKGWQFDANAGEREILARRIGRNELDTIQVCLAFIDMQLDYAALDRDGNGLREYARRFFSSPGKQDGLYWPTAAGQPPSPGGPALAAASAQRDAKAKASGGPVPFHGYYYRILTAQGKHAKGGALNYVVQGKLIGGVAVIAWPARYLASGVQTFMCNTDGVVFQKDLGADTAAQVAKITAFDPDPSWTKLP